MAIPTDDNRAQLIGLDSSPSFKEEDFIRSDCNHIAFQAVMDETDWPDQRLIITGPAKSGKRHLAHVWARRNGACILDGNQLALDEKVNVARERLALVILHANRVAGNTVKETQLFHLCNHIAASPSGRLLLMARQSPALWSIQLPDLASRVEGSRVAKIEIPDDRILAALLSKLFADRQISIKMNVIEYVLPRMERSFAAAQALVADMDRRGLSKGRQITRAIAAESLASLNK